MQIDENDHNFINDEDCEVDLLSNSDYAIGPVTDHVLKRKGETTAKPAILIAKDIVAGDDSEDLRINF